MHENIYTKHIRTNINSIFSRKIEILYNDSMDDFVQISQTIDNAIYKVADFPKPGILFYDITGILTNAKVFSLIIDYYYERYVNDKPLAIAAIDSRGFIFASPVAYLLKLPLLLLRKSGKLPRKTISQEFDLEYGTDALELNPDDIPRGNIVLFDDLLATGGTAKAACVLLESQKAKVQEIASIIALDFLPYKEMLTGYKLHFMVSYDSEKVPKAD